MSDMNNMMRMPGQPPNGMPMQPPMNLNPAMMPGFETSQLKLNWINSQNSIKLGQMGPPPFMGPGNQGMRQMPPMNNQQPPMFPPQQMGMPSFPHHMGPPPHGMMNQFQQFSMNQMPPNMPPFQPPNFQVPPMMGQPPQMQQMQGGPSLHAPPLLNNAPQNPNMIRETITGGPSAIPSSSAPPSNQSSSDSQWLKLFVNNIHPDVPDEFIKKLLEECGSVEKWKRQSDEKGNLNKFGIVEYKMFESVLKCIRILDGFDIMDQKLVVKSSSTTQTFIEQWKQLKSKKWEEEQKLKGSSEFTSFDQFLEKDDSVIRERIELHMKSIDEKVEKVREKKREDEEKKLHPREKDRENKKKQQQREIEKKGKEKLKDWQQVEEDLAREKRKEREREKERERNRQKALERELNYTDDIDRHKQRGRMMERKRQRQRELEEDENDRKKELELLNPPEPEFNIPMPEEPLDFDSIDFVSGLNGQHTDKTVKEVINLNFEEIDLAQNNKNNNDIIEYTIENPRNNIVNQAISKLNIQFKQDFTDKLARGEYVMPAMEEEYQEPVANINEFHSSRAMQIESDNKDPSVKQIFGSLEEEEEEERQRNLRKIELPKIGNARFVEQREIMRKQQETAEEKTPAARQLTEEEMKKELKEILQLVPPTSSNNSALFSFNFNWDLFEKSGLLDKKIKPFLLKKSQELLGQEEQGFVDLIVKKFTQRPTPEKLIRQIVKILDIDESEKFIASLWRIMIFETLKYERFLHIV